MRRWEELFTTQIASSFEVTGDLANRLSDLESRLSMEVREKAQLKERQEHAELIQADLHRCGNFQQRLEVPELAKRRF